MMKEIITLAHGNGGELTSRLIEEFIIKKLDNEYLSGLYDASILNIRGSLAFTTDSFVVNPLFFNGGDIGKLSIFGTANDIAVMGAKPLFMSLSFILEEGLEFETLELVVDSIKEAVNRAGVKIVTGDIKVVERGKGDGIFINTSGIGVVQYDWRSEGLAEGDCIIINGGIGEHGTTIMLQRLGVQIKGDVKSDLQPIFPLVKELINKKIKIKFMRDPTRGGVATLLNEMIMGKSFDVEIDEEQIPMKGWVREFSNILGIEPLHMANEGKLVVVVGAEDANAAIEAMGRIPEGIDARVIGKVQKGRGRVYLRTALKTSRIVEKLKGEPLPRIC
jgi:hydrogenase expression/formation protein HypE